jgi:photosystem II stability/assembly factor-like uncharacterized protein
MKARSIIVSLFGILLLTGGGCFGGGNDASDGSLWSSNDAGQTWSQLAALPSASGVGSIAGVNAASIEVDPTDTSTYYMGTETNGLFYSYDYGTTWNRPETTEITSGSIISIEVDGSNICTIYALKPGELLKSNTCARDWEMVYTETREKEELTAFALDWYDPSIMWLGTSSGEIFKSEDAGETWSLSERIDDHIMDIMISGADSRMILAATKEDGVIRTEDQGETWTLIEDELQKNFKHGQKTYSLTQDKRGERVILNTKYGLVTSTDFGLTWEGIDLLTAPGDTRVWSVAMDPNDSNRFYYATIDAFYSTENLGGAWTTEALPSARQPNSMVVHPDDGRKVLMGFGSVEN